MVWITLLLVLIVGLLWQINANLAQIAAELDRSPDPDDE
jgi:hypothetical protein